MRFGALGSGRGQVDVGLEGAAKFLFKVAAKKGERWNYGI